MSHMYNESSLNDANKDSMNGDQHAPLADFYQTQATQNDSHIDSVHVELVLTYTLSLYTEIKENLLSRHQIYELGSTAY